MLYSKPQTSTYIYSLSCGIHSGTYGLRRHIRPRLNTHVSLLFREASSRAGKARAATVGRGTLRIHVAGYGLSTPRL